MNSGIQLSNSKRLEFGFLVIGAYFGISCLSFGALNYSGIFTVNVVPLPGSLETSIFPRWFSTIR
jgi:hypothetical protein